MGYLRDIGEPFKSGRPTLKPALEYWTEQLFAIVEKLFTWEGVEFKQKEIETRLILRGRVGIVKIGKDIVPVVADGLNGQTYYPDEFKYFNWSTVNSKQGRAVIDKDAILIDNNALRNPTMDIIRRYALILAHTEVTLINALINGRSNKTIVASNQKMAESIRAYQDKILNGSNDAIVDPSFVGLNVLDQANGQNSLNYIKQLYDIRQSLLYSFYEDLGIKKNQQKRERLVSDEVEADTMLLKLNLKDMYDARKEGCEKVNALFGTNWSVTCNIDYDGNGIPESEQEKGVSEDEETSGPIHD